MDNKLMEILACPACKESVALDDDKTFIICSRCKLKYPIKEGIPVMLVDEAVPIEEN